MGAKEISLDPQIINIMEMVIRGDLHQINSLTLQSILKNSANDYENKILLMVQAILERDKVLEEQAADLVKLVDQRTKELEQQKINQWKREKELQSQAAAGIKPKSY